MERTVKNPNARLRRLALLGSVTTVLATTPAYAQDAAKTDDPGAIIVTAQKREQDVRDVPISIAVIGGEKLTDMNVKDFTELDRYVPNLFVQQSPGNRAFYIRGVGSPPGTLGFEQTVGLFVDGVYGGHARQFQAPFLDVERIEVLRGPQGALVGKNTSAGAISIVSAKPTHTFHAGLDATHEFDVGGNSITGFVSGPLADGIAARLAGQYEKTDGYIYNTVLNAKEGGRESWFMRGSMLFDMSDHVDMLIKVEGGKVDLTGSPVERIVYTGTTPNAVTTDPDLKRDASGRTGFVGVDFDNTNSLNASATSNIDIGEHVLTSITGYSSYDYTKRIDSDFGPANANGSEFGEVFNQFSQELRLVSPDTGPVEYIVGGYFHVNDYDLYQSTLGATGTLTERKFHQNNRALSAYGSLTYKVGERVRITGSLRYTDETKNATQVVTSLTAANVFTTIRTLSGNRKENGWDPSINLQFTPTPDLMLYATWGQGSKAGGFVSGQTATLQSQFNVNPEYSETWETGIKVIALDRKLRFNLAAFSTTFKDLQISAYDTAASLAAGTNVFNTLNAGKVRSKGIEADLDFRVTSGITLNGQIAYLDAKYLQYIGASCLYNNPTCVVSTNNLAGLTLPRSPKWSGSVNLDLVQPISSEIELVGNVGMTFRSNTFLEDTYNPIAMQKAYQMIDARLGFRSSDKRWEVAVVGKNLTNQIVAAHAFGTPGVTGQPSPIVGFSGQISKYILPPRTIAAQVKFSF